MDIFNCFKYLSRASITILESFSQHSQKPLIKISKIYGGKVQQ